MPEEPSGSHLRGYFGDVRRTCERPGCSDPVAVVYGYGNDGSDLQIWLDSWSVERLESTLPDGAKGVVCERHGLLLSAPRGWDLVDRRETVPRLFVPRPVLVHSRPVAESPTSDSLESDSSPMGPAVDPSAARRRRRVADLPTPQLFADLRSKTDDLHDDLDDHLDDDRNHDRDRRGCPADDAFESPEVVNPDIGVDHRSDSVDEGLESLLDATGPLLRRAFQKHNTGRHDASKELMRPTTHRVVDESA